MSVECYSALVPGLRSGRTGAAGNDADFLQRDDAVAHHFVNAEQADVSWQVQAFDATVEIQQAGGEPATEDVMALFGLLAERDDEAGVAV